MKIQNIFLLLATPTAAFAPASSARRPPSLRAAPSSIEAILFDCDGVLADTERDGHRLAFNIAFDDSGIDDRWSEDRYGELLAVGGGKERMTAHWDEVGWPSNIRDKERPYRIAGLHLQKTDAFLQLVEDGSIPLRPGVLRVVDEAISAGVRLAVCSTSSETAVRGLVSTLMGEERAGHFAIFAGDMVKSKKPAPDIYLMAVDEMGLDKEKCVIIEDSHIGVGAAVSAGIACLVTKSSYTAKEDFTGAKMVCDELGDDAEGGVTLDTLACLLEDHSTEEECEMVPAPATTSSAWDPIGHVETTTGASWTGARFGEENSNTPAEYTASETYQASSPRGIGVSMEAHIEKGGASWTGARFGDDRANKKAHRYTASETHAASSPRGIGVDMVAHVEKGGASWTGARLGDDTQNGSRSVAKPKVSPAISTPKASPDTMEARGPRGIGVDMVAHIEKGGASWTGARFGDANAKNSRSYTASETFQASSPRGIGVPMEAHVEKGGASWTGARFGDDDSKAARAYTASETFEASSPRGIGVPMEAHVEKGGASWTGARFGDDDAKAARGVKPKVARAKTPPKRQEASSQRGIGVPMEAHVEKGGASWTGARFGDDNSDDASHAYTASETYEFKSKDKSSGSEWDGVAHTDVAPAGTDKSAWSGARFGDKDARRIAPTPSQWHE